MTRRLAAMRAWGASGKGRARMLGALLLAIVLGGCATVSGVPAPPHATAADIGARERRLGELDTFRVSGGFGYWDEQQNLSAAIEWDRGPEALIIRLRAPLGLGRLEVTEDKAGARLERSGRAPVTGPSAAAVLRTALGLGEPVPLDQIGEWIRGLPGSAATAVRRDAHGRLERLVYRDENGQRWRARVRRYREVEGLWLPALLTAVSGQRHLRLALSDWRLGASAGFTGPSKPGDEASTPAAPSRRLPLPGA